MSTTIRQTTLGRNGPKVAALGYGTMGMSFPSYGSIPSEEEQLAILDKAYELGATFWDGADLYGGGEELIGKWFKRTGKRDEIFLASKFGILRGNMKFEVDSSAEYCKKAIELSLKKLDIDCIDLYYMHHANTKTPIEETMRALAELQAQGKIKHIGLCSISSATLRRAVKIAPVAAVQTEYSPFMRDIEGSAGTDLLATCRELGIAVVAAVPLGRGLITPTFASGEPVGDEKDLRPKMMPRFMEENKENNVKLVSQFKELAEKKGCTTTQLSLAWLLKQGSDIIPIPGTKRIKYLEDNCGALNVNLTDEDEAEVRRFLEGVQMAGHYLPEAYLDYNFRDTVEEGA